MERSERHPVITRIAENTSLLLYLDVNFIVTYVAGVFEEEIWCCSQAFKEIFEFWEVNELEEDSLAEFA
jgi:hypothetical protein